MESVESASTVQLYVVLRLAIPAVAALLAIIIARVTSAKDAAAARVIGAGAGVGAIIVHLGFTGIPAIPPIDTVGWIAPAIAAGLLLVLGLVRSPGAGAIALLVVGAATGYLVGKPIWSGLPTGLVGAWIVVFAFAVAIAGAGLGFATQRLHPAAVLAALTLALVGGSIACVASHSAMLSLVMGGFAAATGATVVGGLVLRVPLGGRTLPGVLAVAGGGVMLYAHLYSALPILSALLWGGALVVPALVAIVLPPFRGRSLVALLLAGVLAAGAVGIAQHADDAAESGAGGHDAAEDMYYH